MPEHVLVGTLLPGSPGSCWTAQEISCCPSQEFEASWQQVVTASSGSSALSSRPLLTTPPRVSLPSYVMPSCESDARAKSVEVDDPFKDRELPGGRQGCPLVMLSSLSVLPCPVVWKQLGPLLGLLLAGLCFPFCRMGGGGEWAGPHRSPGSYI